MTYKFFSVSILLIVFANTKCFSQKGRLPTEVEIANTKCSIIKIDSSSTHPENALSFSKIIVADERMDKDELGYFHAITSGKLLKVCLEKNTGSEISSFLNNYFEPAFSQTDNILFVQLKKLWIRNDDRIAYDFSSPKTNNSIHLKIEFYLNQQSCYYPLYKFDSIIPVRGKPEKAAGTLIRDALLLSIQKLQRQPVVNTQRFKCISLSQIDSFNNVIRNVPALTQKNLRKGVYLNFEEFKNNQPSFEEYEVDLGPSADIIYVKGKKIKDSVLVDVWGFSDGENMFIREKSNFFPLYKNHDNFEFYGLNKTQTSRPFANGLPRMGNDNLSGLNAPGTAAYGLTSAAIQGLFERITIRSTNTSLFVLDIETGDVY